MASTPESAFGQGDCHLVQNLLSPGLETGIFEKLKDEVNWMRMSHQGGEVPRLVAVQGHIGTDGSVPIYRHPADESPPLTQFTPTVLAIKEETEKQLGHPLNHVLIQLYRDGTDYISEHSDKTLDISHGSYIANVSVGAQRTMILRTKRTKRDPSRVHDEDEDGARQSQRINLPHNSLLKMGLQTNMKWLHAIRQDKRADRDKTPDELAYGSARISLTFRRISTFMSQDGSIIWGQGATSKTRDAAKSTISGDVPEAIAMLKAFGRENHSSNFDWQDAYGAGFDVLHITSAPRFFAGADKVPNRRISLMLNEYGIKYARGSADWPKGEKPVASFGSQTMSFLRYVDNNDQGTDVRGDIAIMLYLYFGNAKKHVDDVDVGSLYARFYRAMTIHGEWKRCREASNGNGISDQLAQEFSYWDSALLKMPFLGGLSPSLPDFAIWPVLHDIREEASGDGLKQFQNLNSYYQRVLCRDGVRENVLDTHV
ncbi:hypothetical protein VHEMI07877 [[Torrubiella] hemipterigena]|uniref:Fe2OG dioxygenase domain-containing protein n=1 Tax=[Torrubiella] hemipterigena TaxID=1531966 RepID=A0A0A1TM82_9HYPO|nr:hypothetical protein VHEMI07877 [[Torrubiella] hemipterigena]